MPDHQGRRPKGKRSHYLGPPNRVESAASYSVFIGPAKYFTSYIPLLDCVAHVFAKETGLSGAPCTQIGSLSYICLPPFVCGQNCEPVQSLTVTGDAH